jgi:hypothetical protein
MSRMVGLPLVHRKVRMLYLVVFVAIIAISVSAFAATATITNSNNAGYQGVYVQDNGYFGVTNTNFYVVNTAQAATGQPMTWANGGTAYVNALVAADWDITFTLTINAGATASQTYTITVASTAASGVVTNLYTFRFTTLATITAGQTMTIIWDTAATTWTAPYALTITIA